MANSHRILAENEALVIGLEVHDIAVAERGAGNLDENLVGLGRRDWDLVQMELVVARIVPMDNYEILESTV